MAEFRPYPKAAQLSRGERRYRRRVASPKQWQAIIAAKQGPCRVCESPLPASIVIASGGGDIEFYHLVARVHGGGDVEDNIVPLCSIHHSDITLRNAAAGRDLLAGLSDAEYAYMVQRGGESYAERAYGVTYER